MFTISTLFRFICPVSSIPFTLSLVFSLIIPLANEKIQQKLDFFDRLIFSIVCLTFILICVLGALSIFNISRKDNISFNDIGVALTGFGSILGSIIVLPQTIAKHLFPQNGEEVRFNFIKENQRNDQTFLDDNGFDELNEIDGGKPND